MVTKRNNDWLNYCTNALLEYVPDDLGNPESRKGFIEILQHAESVLGYFCLDSCDDDRKHNIAYLLKSVGYGYLTIAAYEAAMGKYCQSVTVIKRMLKPIQAEIAILLSNQATVLEEKGLFDESSELLNQAIELLTSVLDTCENPDYTYQLKMQHLASMYSNMGNVCKKSRDYNEALKWHFMSVAIFETYLDDPFVQKEIATVYNNIAIIHLEKDELNEAEEYGKKALEIREKILGYKHFDTAVTCSVIAGIFLQKKQFEEAEEWFQKDYEIRISIVGDEHPDIAICYNNFAGLCFYQGSYDECILYSKKALKILDAKFSEHPNKAISYFGMGEAYRKKGDFDQAQICFEKALANREKTLGVNHPDTARNYGGLGYLAFLRNDYELSLFWYKKSFYSRISVLGINHPATKITINNIVDQYERLGRLNERQEFIDEIVRLGYHEE